MGSITKIQWTDHTFNPWRGCTKIAEGCKNCYADRQSNRNPNVLGIWGPDGTRVLASSEYWKQLDQWSAVAGDEKPKVFCASLADIFEDWKKPMVVANHPDEGYLICECGNIDSMSLSCQLPPQCSAGCGRSMQWLSMGDARRRLFSAIDDHQRLIFQVLTKRVGNVPSMWPLAAPWLLGRNATMRRHESFRGNVWLGVSASTQEDIDQNIPLLAKCRNLCRVLFLSLEPLVECLDVATWLQSMMSPQGHCLIDWVIIGGESGPHARPCDPKWIKIIAGQCEAANVPVFIKQLGSNPIRPKYHGWSLSKPESYDVISLKDSKGGDPSEWNAGLRVRQMPVVV